MSGTDVSSLLDGMSSARVLAAMSPQQPDNLIRDVLAEGRRRGIPITLLVADLTGRWAFLDDAGEADIVAGRLQMVVLAGSTPQRLARHVDYLPISLWEADRLLGSGALNIDLFLARVQAPGSWGQMIGYSPAGLAAADRVGFEVTAARRVLPGTEVDLSVADVIVPGGPVAGAHGSQPSLSIQQRRIAELTAALVPDEATLQLGVGAIPSGVLDRLRGRHDLGFHSGVLPAGAHTLIASGAVTGAAKTREKGRHVATGMIGTDVFGWGSSALLLPISQTHDPRALLQHTRLWALNSALEVDLAGQVNAEFVDGLRLSSGGGQADFARAAHAGSGASVISLPSRTTAGRSRIVGHLTCPVTTPGSDIDAVVTEFGVAELWGLTGEERAVALVAVAHPDDRAQLVRETTTTRRRTA